MSHITSSSAQRLYLCSRSGCQPRWHIGRLRLKSSEASKPGEVVPGKVGTGGTKSSESTRATLTFSVNKDTVPPTPRRRSKGPLFWGSVAVGSLLVSGGALVAAAKISPDVRSTVEEKYGWIKPVFRVTIGEIKEVTEDKENAQRRTAESESFSRGGSSEGSVKKVPSKKAVVKKHVTSAGTLSGEEAAGPVLDVQQTEQTSMATLQDRSNPDNQQKLENDVAGHLADLEQKREAERQAKEEEQKLRALAAKQRQQQLKAQQEAMKSANAACQHLLDVVEDATESSQALTKHLKAYALQLLEVIELCAAKDVKAEAAKVLGSQQQQVVSRLSSRVGQCETAMEQATTSLDYALVRAVSLGELDGATAVSQKASNAIKKLHQVSEEAAEAQADLNVIEHYCRQVEQRYQAHQDELQRLAHTQANLEDRVAGKGDKGEQSVASLYDADVQSMLAFAQRRVERMQETLESRQKHEAQSVTSLLEEQRREDARVMELKLDHLRHQLQREHNNQLQQKALEAQLHIEEEVCKQVKRQTAAHTEHLKSSLAEHSDRLNRQWQEQLEAELAQQGQRHSNELATITAKLQDAEGVVLRSAEALRAGQDAHVLWDECRALHASLKSSSQRTEPLESRVARIRVLSAESSLAATALDSIPSRALSGGAATEQTLCRRFKRVKTSCGRVALIGEKGGGVFAYLLSYAQSLLIMPYRRWQLSVDSVDLTGLDTYDILELASKRIENRQLEDGVRLMNQLQGQPRQLAQDWLDEARLFLATRQALDLLMAEALLISSAKLN